MDCGGSPPLLHSILHSAPHQFQPHSAFNESTNRFLVTELLNAAGDFTSAGDVNRVLCAVYRAMVERRLSVKEAGTLCDLGQTILHTRRTESYSEKTTAQIAAAKPPRQRVFINDLSIALRD